MCLGMEGVLVLYCMEAHVTLHQYHRTHMLNEAGLRSLQISGHTPYTGAGMRAGKLSFFSAWRGKSQICSAMEWPCPQDELVQPILCVC